LIHPTIWPQYSNITDRQTGQWSDSIGRTVLQMVTQKSSAASNDFLIHKVRHTAFTSAQTQTLR